MKESGIEELRTTQPRLYDFLVGLIDGTKINALDFADIGASVNVCSIRAVLIDVLSPSFDHQPLEIVKAADGTVQLTYETQLPDVTFSDVRSKDGNGVWSVLSGGLMRYGQDKNREYRLWCEGDSESLLGLTNPAQWTISEKRHHLNPDIAQEIKARYKEIGVPKVIPVVDATVAMKTFLNAQQQIVTYRLVAGWPDTGLGEVTIWEQVINDPLTGCAFGPNFTSAEEAWDFLRQNYKYRDI